MPDLNVYIVVIGLEVHVQLLTNSKLFCGDSTLFGNDALNGWIGEDFSEMPDKVAQYNKRKKDIVGLYARPVRRKSNGEKNMATVNKLLIQKLNQ